MTTEAKIAVMQAYVDGQLIEIRDVDSDDWEAASHPGWDWLRYDYRVAEAAGNPGEEIGTENRLSLSELVTKVREAYELAKHFDLE